MRLSALNSSKMTSKCIVLGGPVTCGSSLKLCSSTPGCGQQTAPGPTFMPSMASALTLVSHFLNTQSVQLTTSLGHSLQLKGSLLSTTCSSTTGQYDDGRLPQTVWRLHIEGYNC